MSDTGNLMFVIAFWTPFVLVAVSLNVVLCLGKLETPVETVVVPAATRPLAFLKAFI
jgi:hypothetical protein